MIKRIMLGVFLVVFLMISTATALPQVHSAGLQDRLEQKKLIIDYGEGFDFSTLIEFILKVLRFMQNVSSMLLSLLTPFLPLLERMASLFENILEKLEPWGVLGQAILDVIEAIYALIEALQNIIDPPSLM